MTKDTADVNLPLKRLCFADWRTTLAPTTQVNYQACVNRVGNWLRGQGKTLVDATKADLQLYLVERLESGLTGATVHGDWKAIRAFYGWCQEEDELEVNPAEKLKAPKVVEGILHIATEAEVKTLLQACDRNPDKLRGRRDAAILSLLWCGMRRGELCGLDVGHVDLMNEVLVIPTTKGGVPRRILLDTEAYKRVRRVVRNRADDEPLFVGQRGRLTPSGIEQAIQPYRDETGLRSVTLHSFRRGFTAWAREHGISSDTIMTNNGWTDTRMIGRYTRAAAEDLAMSELRRVRGNRSLRSVG